MLMHHDSSQVSIPRRAWFTVLALALINVIGMTVVVPVLPFVVLSHLPDQQQLALWVGVLEAVNALCAFLSAPFLGALSDRVGRRPVIVIASFGAALGFLVFGIGGAMWVLVLGRVIQGITAGDMPALFGYVADITRPQDRAKRFGMLGAVSGAGFMVGPALGGLLAQIDTALPLFVTAGLSLVVSLLAVVALPETVRTRPGGQAGEATERPKAAQPDLSSLHPFGAIAAGFRRPGLRPVLTGFVLVMLPFLFMVNNSSVLALDTIGWGPTQIGITTASIGVLDILVQGVALRWALKHWGERGVILAGVVVQGVGCLALVLLASLLAQPWLVVVGMLAFGAGEGATTATMNGVLSASVDEHEQGWVGGVRQALESGTGIVAPVLVGLIYTGWGPWMPYALGALMQIGALVVLARIRPAVPSRGPHEVAGG